MNEAWHLGLPWSPDKDIKTGLKGLLARGREPGASPQSTELGDSAPATQQKRILGRGILEHPALQHGGWHAAGDKHG